MRPTRCSRTAGFHGSSMLRQALAARWRSRPTPPASVAKRMRHAGSSWTSTMFCVRRFWPSSPVKNAARTLSRASTSRVAQCASRSILRHWLNTTTFRAWSRASWPSSSRSSRSFGHASPFNADSLGRSSLDRSGQTSSKRSWARPLAIIPWAVSSDISRTNSGSVSARRLDPATSRWIGLLQGEGRLGRAVRDAVGLVEHDEVRVPLAHDVHVAEELFVVGHEEPAAARVERGAALGGIAVDHGGRRVGEQLPLAEPLGLERGGDDQQAAADAPRVPERVAGGDRLRGLAEAHVVGEEKPPTGKEPLDAVTLIRVES